jgi:hypothetical protein
MHRDIAVANAPALTHRIDAMIAELGRVRELVAGSDSAALLAYFEETQDSRIRWRVERERATDESGGEPGMPEVPSLGETMQSMFFGGLASRRRRGGDNKK